MALEVVRPVAESILCGDEHTEGAPRLSRGGPHVVPRHPGARPCAAHFDLLDKDLVLKLWPRERCGLPHAKESLAGAAPARTRWPPVTVALAWVHACCAHAVRLGGLGVSARCRA